MRLITEILSEYKDDLGSDYPAYHNHAQRVFQLAQILDSETVLNPTSLGIACAFHDLGIWTENTWDYLQPSEKLCENYLGEHFQEVDASEVIIMIGQHHKLFRYKGPFEDAVEIFRRADLIDFSGGLIRFGIEKRMYDNLLKEFPQNGFHGVLFKKFRKHILRKPWNPLPMVKL